MKRLRPVTIDASFSKRHAIEQQQEWEECCQCQYCHYCLLLENKLNVQTEVTASQNLYALLTYKSKILRLLVSTYFASRTWTNSRSRTVRVLSLLAQSNANIPILWVHTRSIVSKLVILTIQINNLFNCTSIFRAYADDLYPWSIHPLIISITMNNWNMNQQVKTVHSNFYIILWALELFEVLYSREISFVGSNVYRTRLGSFVSLLTAVPAGRIRV